MANERELSGLWRRTYLAAADGTTDTTTWVAWLQGQRYYCDLRQPAGLRAFPGVRCLRDLGDEDLIALANQQGFAGPLRRSGNIAHWRRDLDFQPPTGIADRATIDLQGDLLVEIGTEAPYVEHWTRLHPKGAPAFDASVSDGLSGARAVIVLVGSCLMLARGRATRPPSGKSLLTTLAATPALSERQELLDFEISFGTVDSCGRWHIERSTLPFKAGRSWVVEFDLTEPATVHVEDLDAAGARFMRHWTAAAMTQDAERDLL